MSDTRLGIPIVILLSICFTCIAHASTKIESIAKIHSIVGDVQVSKNGDDKWVAATQNMEIRSGGQIKTGPKSSCVIEWGQGNVLKLTPFTNMKIERLDFDMADKAENASLNIWTGKTFAKAKKLASPDSNFEVRTPTAIAGVRGTKLAVGVDADGTTDVECEEGAVSVKSNTGGEVLLAANQSTTVKKDEAPSAPAAMSSDDAASFSDLDDSLGATLEIIQPVGDLETNTSPITIKGQTDPGGTVTVNGQTVIADQAGIFTVNIDLEEGVNHIKIDAANKKGKVTTKTRVIKYSPAQTGTPTKNDTTPPMLQISQPAGVFSPNAYGCSAQGTVSINCVITGLTDPKAVLTINDIRCMSVKTDGSFSCPVTVDYSAPVIEIDATSPSGNRTSTILKRDIDSKKAEYLEVAVSPATMTANGQNTAAITVRTTNLLRDPVSASVTLQATTGGVLSQSVITTDSTGVGTATFRAGVGGAVNTVAITAATGTLSATANITLTPDVPIGH